MYPEITFTRIDLDRTHAIQPLCDLVTCFETLEHVGNLNLALDNLLAVLKPGGTALITVPVEHGWRGALKLAIKMLYGYDLSELPQAPGLWRRYVRALLTGERMSQFRDQRPCWGTHFGFDYRDLDDALQARSVLFLGWNSGTTRFYRIEKTSRRARS